MILRRSAYAAVFIVFRLGMSFSKITPRSSQKRVSINFPGVPDQVEEILLQN
jgi:hypothetical protein